MGLYSVPRMYGECGKPMGEVAGIIRATLSATLAFGLLLYLPLSGYPVLWLGLGSEPERITAIEYKKALRCHRRTVFPPSPPTL